MAARRSIFSSGEWALAARAIATTAERTRAMGHDCSNIGASCSHCEPAACASPFGAPKPRRCHRGASGEPAATRDVLANAAGLRVLQLEELGAAQVRAHQRHELFGLKRLANEVVASSGEPLEALFERARCGEKDDRKKRPLS